MRLVERRLQLLERLMKYGVCGAVRCVAAADAVEVKIDGRWEPHVILTLCLGLGLSLSLSLSLRRLVVRELLVLVLRLQLLLHFHFHFGRLLVRPCFSWCGLLQRSSRAQRDARSGPLIQVRPGTVRQGGVFWSRLSRHFRMTGALGREWTGPRKRKALTREYLGQRTMKSRAEPTKVRPYPESWGEKNKVRAP